MKSAKAINRQVHRQNSRPSNSATPAGSPGRGIQVGIARGADAAVDDQGDPGPQRAARPGYLLHHAVRAGSRRGAERRFAHAVHRVHHRISGDHGGA